MGSTICCGHCGPWQQARRTSARKPSGRRSRNSSWKTADAHRTNLMQKLDLHDARSLALYAVRRGLIAGE
jgi:hypothetical protein